MFRLNAWTKLQWLNNAVQSSKLQEYFVNQLEPARTRMQMVTSLPTPAGSGFPSSGKNRHTPRAYHGHTTGMGLR